MRSTRWRIACAAALLTAGATLAAADEPQQVKTQEGARENVFRLGEVTATAAAESSVAATQVTVGEDEIRLFDRKTVSEAANLVPGVTMSRMGARNESTLYLRGFDIKHVPIYLDGIPIYVPYDGYPDLGRFFTHDLSEVVVSKGFASVLYGLNTMGGAINMVSKRPSREIEGNAGVGYAAGETFDAFANLGARQRLWYAQGGASWEHSDGFRLSGNFRPTAAEDGGLRNNAYHRDWKVSAKVGWTPREGDEYALTYSRQRGVKGTPPYAGSDSTYQTRYWRWPYWDKDSIYFTSKTALGEKTYVKVRIFRDSFENSLFAYDDATYGTMNKMSSFKSNYDDYTFGGSVEARTRLVPMNDLALAVHFKDDVHREMNSESSPVQRFEDRMFSVGIEDTIRLSPEVSIVAGLSHDVLVAITAQDYSSTTRTISDFPRDDTSAWNPQLGIFHTTADLGTVRAVVSMKSRLPSIKDRYSYRLGTALPNPGLQPERSVSYEAGWETSFAGVVKWGTTVFFHDVTDYILLATVPDPVNSGRTLNQNQNIGKVQKYGLELEISAPITRLAEVGGDYTFIQSDNLTNSLEIIDVPQNKARAYARIGPVRAISLLGTVEYDSRRYSSTDGRRVAGPFALVDVKATWEPVRALVLEAGVRNLVDRNYALDEGFPEPGRTFFTQARYSF